MIVLKRVHTYKDVQTGDRSMQIVEPLRGQAGSVLIVMAVLMLALLSIYGVSATRSGVTESRIAGNHHLHKMAFYQADGGARVAVELIRDNIRRRGRSDKETVQGITLDDGSLYLSGPLPAGVRPNRKNKSAHYPVDDSIPPFTQLMIGGKPSLSRGGAILAFNGYAGLGQAAARGGAWFVYDIRSRYCGRRNNEAIVELFYRHVLL
jgi:hypothetical protein